MKLLLFLFPILSYAIVGGVQNSSMNKKVLKIRFTRFRLPVGGICTATLISQNQILTAAHCVKSIIPKKSFTQIEINSKIISYKSIRVPDEYWNLQKKYDDAISNDRSFSNELKNVSVYDYAIIKLRKNVDHLFEVTSVAKSFTSSQRVTLCGYGYTEFKDNKFQGNKKKELYCGENNGYESMNNLYIFSNLHKANYSFSITAAGDSGSPLFNDKGEQVGVLSGIVRDIDGDATSYYAKPSFL